MGPQSASTVVSSIGARSAAPTKERDGGDVLFCIQKIQIRSSFELRVSPHARLRFGKSCATSASQLVTSCATFAACFTAQNGSATSAS